LVATAGFGADHWTDLKQEFILDLLRRSRKFDPARGDWQGFVRGVARNHAAVLVMRKRRRASEVSIQDLMNGEDASEADVLDGLDRRPSWAGVDALDHALDVRRIVERLPDHLRLLTGLLGQMPVKEVCRHIGKSRSRVYEMTRQIREAFLRAGYTPSRVN
jgi:DNA-directed RNA polymerase specialized sigma24 family protein